MDITSLSLASGIAQSGIMKDVGTALLAKSIDQTQVTADNLTKMIDSASLERSVNPHLGGNIDLFA